MVVFCEAEGMSPVVTSPDLQTNLSSCIFLGSFSQILRGSTDPKKGEELVNPNLDSSRLMVPYRLHEGYQKDIQRITGPN